MDIMHIYWTMMEISLALAIALSILLAALSERAERRPAGLMLLAMPLTAAVIMAAPFLIMGVNGRWWQGSGPRTLGGTALFDIMPVVVAASVLAGAVIRARWRNAPGARGPMSTHLSCSRTLDRSAYGGAIIRVGLLFGAVAFWTGAAGIFYVDSEPGGPRREGSDAHAIMVMEWTVTGLVAGVILAMQRLRETAVPPVTALILPFCALAGLVMTGAFGTPWPLILGCAAYLAPAFVPQSRKAAPRRNPDPRNHR